jgi:bla regulator protein blaR1
MQYGEMLLDVSQRPSVYIGAVAAMSESKSFLEERITIMVRDPAKWGSVATLLFGSLALALVAVAAQVTPPNVGSSDRGRPVILTPAALDQYTGFYVRGANLIFAITRDGARLLLQVPAHDPMEIIADSNMNFVAVNGSPPFTFVRDGQDQITGLVLHYGTTFSVPMPRIDASTAQQILADNDVKARSQTPTPGSEAALRRLIDAIRAGKPNYDEMAPWFAELVRETTDLNRLYARWGAVQSIEFRHVDIIGGDVYEVRQEGGLSTWTIFLDSNGLIEDAINFRGG